MDHQSETVHITIEDLMVGTSNFEDITRRHSSGSTKLRLKDGNEDHSSETAPSESTIRTEDVEFIRSEATIEKKPRATKRSLNDEDSSKSFKRSHPASNRGKTHRTSHSSGSEESDDTNITDVPSDLNKPSVQSEEVNITIHEYVVETKGGRGSMDKNEETKSVFTFPFITTDSAKKGDDISKKMILKVERVLVITSVEDKDGKVTTTKDFVENACCFYIKQNTNDEPEDVPAVTMKRRHIETLVTIDGKSQKPEIQRCGKVEFGEPYERLFGKDPTSTMTESHGKPMEEALVKLREVIGSDHSLSTDSTSSGKGESQIPEKETVTITVSEYVLELQTNVSQTYKNTEGEKVKGFHSHSCYNHEADQDKTKQELQEEVPEVKKPEDNKNEGSVRDENGCLVFKDYPDFKPNLTPKEILQRGSFGGTYFRPIYSSVTNQNYGEEVWQELPKSWLQGLDVKTQVASSKYDPQVNMYKVRCGGSLKMWEKNGWMSEQDPYGWFQWYCRFYQGRRCDDDGRQIQRWIDHVGPHGIWRNHLIGKIIDSNSTFDDETISRGVRQTLQHWAYVLTESDFDARVNELEDEK